MDYDPNEDARRCYWLAIAEKRKAHVAQQLDDWQTLPELYAWEAGPLFAGKGRNADPTPTGPWPVRRQGEPLREWKERYKQWQQETLWT